MFFLTIIEIITNSKCVTKAFAAIIYFPLLSMILLLIKYLDSILLLNTAAGEIKISLFIDSFNTVIELNPWWTLYSYGYFILFSLQNLYNNEHFSVDAFV